MSFSIGGGKESKKSKETLDQTQTSTLSDRASGLLTGGIGDLRGKSYAQLDPSAVAKWADPYAKEVRDATMGQLGYDRDVARNGMKAAFAKAGAFGDDRRGIYEAELDGQYDRTAASTLAGLNSAGFAQALDIAQSENENANTYDLNIQDLIARMIAGFGTEGTTRTNGTSTGRSTGYNISASGSPFGK